MKHKILVGILSIETILLVLFSILQTSFAGVFSTVMAFPFEQIGLGLRSLSLSGAFGNAAAFVVYFAVSLLPVAALLVLRKKRRLCKEDGLLVLLSIVLFAVLYFMINPGFLSLWPSGAGGLAMGKAVLGVMVYSVLVGYFVLRILRRVCYGGTERLIRYMPFMLGLLNVLFVYLIFGAYLSDMFGSFETLRAGNVGNEHLLGATYVFLAMQFLVDALPYVFCIFIIFAALKILDEMKTDRYSSGTVAAAEQIFRLCVAALVTTVLANIGFNLLQFLFAGYLVVISSSVQIPIFGVAFVFAALLLTRLVTENKQLKDDNELFI